MLSVMIGAKKLRFDQCAGHCVVSNFRLHRDSHLQIPTATETPSVPTLARQLSCIYTAHTSLACVTFATILHFQTLATCQVTTWLVVTRTAAGHPSSVLLQAFHQSMVVTRTAGGHPSSVLLQAFHQSNFAILAICPHTLDG